MREIALQMKNTLVKLKVLRTKTVSRQVEFFQFKGFTSNAVQSAHSIGKRPKQTSTESERRLSGIFIFKNIYN